MHALQAPLNNSIGHLLRMLVFAFQPFKLEKKLNSYSAQFDHKHHMFKPFLAFANLLDMQSIIDLTK